MLVPGVQREGISFSGHTSAGLIPEHLHTESHLTQQPLTLEAVTISLWRHSGVKSGGYQSGREHK